MICGVSCGVPCVCKLIIKEVCVMKLKRLNNKVCVWLPYQTMNYPCDMKRCANWFKAMCKNVQFFKYNPCVNYKK